MISKTLGKSSSPPTISAPPKAAVGVSKVKKDEVQRHKNSFHDMLRGSQKENDDGNGASLNVPVAGATQTPASLGHGARGRPNTAVATTAIATADRRSSEHRKRSAQEGRRSLDRHKLSTQEDDRLAVLEQSLAAAREESAALRHELDRVKQDAQAFAEVSRYQAEHHAPLEDAEMQTEPGNEALHDEHERYHDLLVQNNDLHHRLAGVEEQLLSQAAHLQPKHSDSDWENLTLRLHEAEKESQARLEQLLSLKSSISSLTRSEPQISDAELAERFSQLANRVREWVVSNYRRSKLNFDGLPEASLRVLRSIKSDFGNVDAADKLAFYQAVVSRTLMRMFDDPWFFGMPDRGPYGGLQDFAAMLEMRGVDSREWRRVTLRLVERVTLSDVMSGWEREQLASLASELEGLMLSMSSTEITSSARYALIGILKAAADLQRTLCLQKAAYKVIVFVFPWDDFLDHDHQFDDRTMEPINELEEPMDEQTGPQIHRKFKFCVFPCLQKIDDGVEHIIFRARVCSGVG